MQLKRRLPVILVLACSALLASAALAKPRRKRPEPEAPATAPVEAASDAGVAPEPPPAPPPSPPPPAPVEPPAPPDAEPADGAALRAELTTLMDDLVKARAQAALLGKTLFKTRLRVRLQNLAAPDPVLTRIVITLDGAPVFRGDGAVLRDDEARQLWDGYVAPGPHVLGVELEQRARGDATFGYILRESYSIKAARDRRTELTVVIDDDSDMAEDFPDDGEGEYDVRTRLRAKTHEP